MENLKKEIIKIIKDTKNEKVINVIYSLLESRTNKEK